MNLTNEKTTGISTFVDYTHKDKPRDVEIFEGKKYQTRDPHGYERSVEIIKIRIIDGTPVIYFKWPSVRKFFGMIQLYGSQTMSLDSFEMILLDLGSVPSLKISGEYHAKKK